MKKSNTHFANKLKAESRRACVGQTLGPSCVLKQNTGFFISCADSFTAKKGKNFITVATFLYYVCIMCV